MIFIILIVLLILVVSLSEIVNNDNGLGKYIDYEAALQSAKLSNCLCVGIKCKDGALLAAIPRSYKENNKNDNDNKNALSNNINVGIARWIEEERKYLYKIDECIGAAIVGIPSDTTHVVQLLREESLEYRSKMGLPIPLSLLADSVSDYFYNLISADDTRPLAVDIILTSSDDSYDAIHDTDKFNTNIIKLDNSGSYEECNFCTTKTLIDDSTDDKLSIIDKCTDELTKVQWNALSCQEASIEIQKFASTFFGMNDFKPQISFIQNWKYINNAADL